MLGSSSARLVPGKRLGHSNSCHPSTHWRNTRRIFPRLCYGQVVTEKGHENEEQIAIFLHPLLLQKHRTPMPKLGLQGIQALLTREPLSVLAQSGPKC